MSQKAIFIAGPCVIESAELLNTVARKLVEINEKQGTNIIFKASFDKANRTSIRSFRGPGLERGLQMLADIKTNFGLQILTDIHEAWQAKPVGEVCDVIQIPAFLCRQTDLLIAAAQTGRIVNIKKAQFLSGRDMRYPVIVPTVIMDCTHSVQRPGDSDGKTGGDRRFVPQMAKAAKAFGATGYFFEVHPTPDQGLSDAANMLELDKLEQLIVELNK